jgi:hypothetical protein
MAADGDVRRVPISVRVPPRMRRRRRHQRRGALMFIWRARPITGRMKIDVTVVLFMTQTPLTIVITARSKRFRLARDVLQRTLIA